MNLKLEVVVNNKMPDELGTLCQLVREGWEIGRIENVENIENRIKFTLVRS